MVGIMKHSLFHFLVWFILFSSTALADHSTNHILCEPELSSFLSANQHRINYSFDLVQCYRMGIDNWDDAVLMVESGSLMIVDQQFMIIDLHFSRNYDYALHNDHLPHMIMLTNQNPLVSPEETSQEWKAWMFPDRDDPYAFHYMCTWNHTMYSIDFYGEYINSQGEYSDCFELHIDL